MEAEADPVANPPTPGSPHPPAPEGATFVSDQRIITPGDVKLHIDAYFLHRDNRDEELPVGEGLVFKTPKNDARGFVVRWHYYEATATNDAGRFIIDFEVVATGMIFHRIEGTMPKEQLLVTSKENRAVSLQTTQIGRNGLRHFLSLMHARHPTDPTASATDWWDLYCSIDWVDVKEKDTEPAFQLPPSPQ